MFVDTNNRIPIKIWLNNKDDFYNSEELVKQAYNLANLPFAFKHISLMPDCHAGYGMPIGGVLATENVIIPNAVGVDIGCGMIAIRTSLTSINNDTLKLIVNDIKKNIPVGFNKRDNLNYFTSMPKGYETCKIVETEFENAIKSLGTLGGGNHFIEIQKGSDNHIWIMIHTGSRNLGYKVAKHYNNIAVELNEKWHSKVPKEWQLAFLPTDTKDAQEYIKEMNYCVNYAYNNRGIIINTILNIFIKNIPDVEFDNKINIAHNYASIENHFGHNVWVHRKGATLAREGTVGIIPGSQGTKSYIVKGKGNKDSFTSCSHGAGRLLGRKEAQRKLDLNTVINNLDKQHIIHSIKEQKDLDEAPEAYKDISEVIQNEVSLIETLVELKPLAVIKG